MFLQGERFTQAPNFTENTLYKWLWENRERFRPSASRKERARRVG
jgi:hypothetical protein